MGSEDREDPRIARNTHGRAYRAVSKTVESKVQSPHEPSFGRWYPRWTESSGIPTKSLDGSYSWFLANARHLWRAPDSGVLKVS